jgi:NADH dehydrogenase
MHKVAILGGGFGGLYAAKALRKAEVDITLVDRRNFHLFQPLLYQVATGSLSSGEITSPLRAVLRDQKNTRVLLGEAVDLDADRRELMLADGVIPYDTLIVATGVQNSYFGHDEWRPDAPGLKSIEDATTIRSKILFAYEAAERETHPDRQRAWLTFVIVGGGATGVELAGALAEIANDTLRHDFRSIRPEQSRILLIEGSEHVLPSFPESLSVEAERSLIHLGVLPRTKTFVTAIDWDSVTLKTPNGIERLETRTVLWGAGVKASGFGEVLARRAGAQLDKMGRVMVTPDLTLPTRQEIFVIGDLAHFEQNGKPVPGVAPVAMQQGRYVAASIIARLRETPAKPFSYWDKGNLAVIGRASAVVDTGKLRFHGPFAWLIWLVIHILYLAQFRNRFIVMTLWAFEYLTFEKGSRLITRDFKEPNQGDSNQRPG